MDNGIAASYREQGYVVVPGLISAGSVNLVLEKYNQSIRPSTRKFFRQNSQRYERNVYDSYGHVNQSFLDIHNYRNYPEFRRAVLDIFLAPKLLAVLRQLTGNAQHNLMQTMLFDANTETWPHQDWWYLDSVPNGNLLAAWIALEDIHKDAGRFYVISGSQNVRLHEEGLPHDAWIERMRAYVKSQGTAKHVPALKKGDVLFWNSRVVHGSLPTVDNRHSRKSLTAHYMPSEMAFGNLFTVKPWVKYEKINGQLCFANQPEYSFRADIVSSIKRAIYSRPALMKLARRLQHTSIADFVAKSDEQPRA